MKKNISLFALLSVIAIFLIGFVFFSNTNEVKAQNISSLGSIVSPGFSFKMDLKLGDTDPSVMELQRVLNADVDTVIALKGDGSPDQETTYFGEKTRQAVIKFQNKYKSVILTPAGLTTGNGIVNKLTRTKLNLLIGVFNTYNSVGSPQGSANSTVNVTPAPVIVSTPAPAPVGISICQFVGILKNANIISAAKASAAENTFSCPVLAVATPALAPTVTLKVNGHTDSTRVVVNTNATISWTSKNATYCYTSNGNQSVSGSLTKLITTSGTLTISCAGAGGTATDSVTVTAVTATVAAASTTTASTSNYVISTSTFASNVFKKVLKSDGGSNDVVVIPASNTIRNDSIVTIEAWVKPTEWREKSTLIKTSDAVILSKGYLGDNIDYALSLDKGKLVYSNNDAGIWTCDAIVPLNAWTHVAATVDESAKDISLYVNGVKATSTCQGAHGIFGKSSINKQYAITNSATSTDLFIANYYSKYCDKQTGTNGFIGSLDDIRIWNKVRTAAEIIGNMATSVKNTTGLVAYWAFDNSAVSDITNNSNEGLILGNIKIVTDTTASSTIVSDDNGSRVVTNASKYLSCEDNSIATTTEEVIPEEEAPRVDVTFAGQVEYVGYCGTKDNPNKYSSVVIKSLGGATPVVANVTGSPTRSYGQGDPNSRLILRHSPSTGAPLPTVGSCVIGRSNGEIDVCSTTDTPYKSASGALIGTGTGGAPKAGNGYVAGGIIMALGFDDSKDCSIKEIDSGSGTGFGLQTGAAIAGCAAGMVAGPFGCIAGAAVGSVVGSVLESFGF